MNTLEQQYRKSLIFLIVVMLAGSGYWILRHFRPDLFLGKPDLVVDSEAHPPAPDEPAKSPSVFQKLIPASEIVVHVAGAVQSPGVYRLSSGARVQNAIEKAGGGTTHADIHRLNLAAKVRDGQQIYVPEVSRSASLPTPHPSQIEPRANPTFPTSAVGLPQSLVNRPTPMNSSLID